MDVYKQGRNWYRDDALHSEQYAAKLPNFEAPTTRHIAFTSKRDALAWKPRQSAAVRLAAHKAVIEQKKALRCQ